MQTCIIGLNAFVLSIDPMVISHKPRVWRTKNNGNPQSGQKCRFRTKVRNSHINISDPGVHVNSSGGLAHRLGGGNRIIVHFRAKDGLEATVLGCASNLLYFARPPSDSWDDPDRQPLPHTDLPSGSSRTVNSRCTVGLYSLALSRARAGLDIPSSTPHHAKAARRCRRSGSERGPRTNSLDRRRPQ
jgi:hypothetical protein